MYQYASITSDSFKLFQAFKPLLEFILTCFYFFLVDVLIGYTSDYTFIVESFIVPHHQLFSNFVLKLFKLIGSQLS